MSIKGIIKGTVFAYLITFAVIVILSVISYFCKVDNKIITVGVYSGVVFGVFLGAFAVSKHCEKSVLLHAMLVSIIYIFILAAISMLINHTLYFNKHFLTMVCGILSAGFLGAVIGK
ncbi:MAG: TIGR04086 family membrane protein [Clostridia bacterium]|nr:TIGR04086 family membrane protein [Clostridia bacterium]